MRLFALVSFQYDIKQMLKAFVELQVEYSGKVSMTRVRMVQPICALEELNICRALLPHRLSRHCPAHHIPYALPAKPVLTKPG